MGEDDQLHIVKRILSQIAELQGTLNRIQSECSHDTEISFNKERNVRIICKICKAEVGYPSLKEVHEFLKR